MYVRIHIYKALPLCTYVRMYTQHYRYVCTYIRMHAVLKQPPVLRSDSVLQYRRQDMRKPLATSCKLYVTKHQLVSRLHIPLSRLFAET